MNFGLARKKRTDSLFRVEMARREPGKAGIRLVSGSYHSCNGTQLAL